MDRPTRAGARQGNRRVTGWGLLAFLLGIGAMSLGYVLFESSSLTTTDEFLDDPELLAEGTGRTGALAAMFLQAGSLGAFAGLGLLVFAHRETLLRVRGLREPAEVRAFAVPGLSEDQEPSILLECGTCGALDAMDAAFCRSCGGHL